MGSQYDTELGKISPLVERADKSAKAVLAQQQILTQGRHRAARHQPPVVGPAREMAETVASLKVQQNATIAEISAAGQLVMPTRSASASRPTSS